MENTRVVILAGGKGRRLLPYTTILPKPLLPVGDTPILEIVIRQLKKQGFRDITLSVGYLAALIKTFFGDGKKFGVKISYSIEHESLGTAGPLSLLDDISDTFIVMNGDLLTNFEFSDILKYHKRKKSLLTVGIHKQNYEIPLGFVEHKNHRIINYIEKPVKSYDVGMGIYVIEPEVLGYIPHGKPMDFPDLILKLIKVKKRVFGYQSKDTWIDMGKPEGYETAISEFEKNRCEFI